MSSNKITYIDKVGIVSKEIHKEQFWDDDANEIKSKHNLNDDRITALETSLGLKFDKVGGILTGAITVADSITLTHTTSSAVFNVNSLADSESSINFDSSTSEIVSWDGNGVAADRTLVFKVGAAVALTLKNDLSGTFIGNISAPNLSGDNSGDQTLPTDFDPAGTDNSDNHAVNNLYKDLVSYPGAQDLNSLLLNTTDTLTGILTVTEDVIADNFLLTGSSASAAQVSTAWSLLTGAPTDNTAFNTWASTSSGLSHANRATLDKFSENSLGFPTYNGNAVDTTIAQRDVHDTLTSSDNTISLSAKQGKTLKDVQDTQQTAINLNTAKVTYPGDQDLSGYLLNVTDTLTGVLTVTDDVIADNFMLTGSSASASPTATAWSLLTGSPTDSTAFNTWASSNVGSGGTWDLKYNGTVGKTVSGGVVNFTSGSNITTSFSGDTLTSTLNSSITITGNASFGGSVRVGDDSTSASAANVGSTRYKTAGNNSYTDMCMQTGAATYAWINIVQNNW